MGTEARVNKSNKKVAKALGFIAVCCASANGFTAPIQVVGPVEGVSAGRSEITVLGQRFTAPSSSLVVSRLDHGASASTRSSGVGSYVVVVGERLSDGTLVAKSIKNISDPYVPGASDVYLRGTVDKYSAVDGVLQIGGLQVLVSDALATNSPNYIYLGASIEILGTQAVPGGQVWASKINVIPVENTDALGTSIQGTGLQATSIQGTGLRAISIQGTGAQATSIQGTGLQATSIQGTGKQAAATSIQGTGVQATSIQGTGLQATSIQGTGFLATSIQGTGKQAAATSIQGTGLQATSIQGTGMQAASIQGTGVESSSIQGTGFTLD